MQIYFYLFIW